MPKQEIVENGYDLSINKYKKVEYVAEEYPPTSELISIIKASEEEFQFSLTKLEGLLK